MARLGRVQPLEVFAGYPLMHLGELRMGRRERQGHVSAREQQGIHRRIKAQRAFEGVLVRAKIGRWRKPQLERRRTQVSIGNPSEKGQQRHEVELETLPRHGMLTPEQLEDKAASFMVVCESESGCVAEDVDIADGPLEGAEQVCGRHHRVSDHIEASCFHHVWIRQPNCRVAGTRRCELPQAADPLSGKASIGVGQRRKFEPCLLKQRVYMEPCCLQRLGDALDPKSRTGRLINVPFVHRPPPFPSIPAFLLTARRVAVAPRSSSVPTDLNWPLGPLNWPARSLTDAIIPHTVFCPGAVTDSRALLRIEKKWER